MNPEKIGKFIAELRKEKKLTQIELAKNICVSNKTVSKWECGNAIPDYGVFENLCNEFDITVTELLAGERNVKDVKIIGKYIKSRENKQRKEDFIFILFMILVLCFLPYFFINGDKNDVFLYKIQGESENFKFENGMIYLSDFEKLYHQGNLIAKNDAVIKDQIIDKVLVVEIDNKYYKLFDKDGNLYNIDLLESMDKSYSHKMLYILDNLYMYISYLDENEEVFFDMIEISSTKLYETMGVMEINLSARIDKKDTEILEIIVERGE